MANVNVKNFKLFTSMSPDVPSFKVRVLQVTLNFELELMNIRSSRHSNSNFSHSFDFHRLTNFANSINLSWMVSLWCALLCKY